MKKVRRNFCLMAFLALTAMGLNEEEENVWAC